MKGIPEELRVRGIDYAHRTPFWTFHGTNL